MEIRIVTPLTYEKVKDLKAGDHILLSGTILTARDAAHKRLIQLMDQSKDLPIELKDAIIYNVRPTAEKLGQPIGSAGPTTRYRMDSYTPKLLERGLRSMIGKGARSEDVIQSMKKNGAGYFG